MKKKTLTLGAALGLVPAFLSPSALAHQGGHQGGCEEFGQLNRAIGQDPAGFGLPEARTLGDD